MIASLSGSARASRIVSDRGGLSRSRAPSRLSEPRIMNVRGPPASARVELGDLDVGAAGPRIGSRMSSTSRSTAVATAAPVSTMISSARQQGAQRQPRPTRGGRSPRLHAAPPSTARSGRRVLGQRGGDGAREVDEQLAVAGERADRDPLLGTVVAGAGGPELDRRDAGAQERHGVRRAVAADRHRLAVASAARRPRTARARTGSSATRARAGR